MRSPLVTLMHVLGLAVGLACFIMSFFVIQSMRSTDTHFRNAPRIYALTQELWMGNAAKRVTPPMVQAPLAAAPYLKTDFPQLAAVARAVRGTKIAVSTGDRNLFLYGAMVDPEFLQIFDLPFVAGDPAHALESAGGAVITQAAALRLFGTKDVLGRRMLIANSAWVSITGVIKGVPPPSHMGDPTHIVALPFDILTHMNTDVFGSAVTDWDTPATITYVMLPADGSLTVGALRTGLRSFSDRHMPRSQGHSKFDVVPVSEIGLSYMNALLADTGLSFTAILLLLDGLVLSVACLNYANLTSALALRRSHEIAMRKIVGASRGQLLLQCVLDAAAVGLLALVLVLVLVGAAVPLLNAAFHLGLGLAQLARPGFWLFVLALVAATSLVSAAYPAWALSRLRPVEALRSEAARTGPRSVFRALVAVQFAAAAFLIVMVLVAREQNRTMAAALPGLLRNPSIAVTTSLVGSGVDPETLHTELAHSPYVRSVSATSQKPWDISCCWVFNLTHSPDSAERQIHAAAYVVGYDFFDTIGLRLLVGRTFDRELGDEVDLNTPFKGKTWNVIVDRDLTARLGWPDPAVAVGKTVYRPALWGGTPQMLRIIGVVESGAPRLLNVTDTNSNVYILAPSGAAFPVIRIDPQHIREAVFHIESTWHTLAPRLPLEWRFMDDLFEEAYALFSRVSAIAMGLAIFAFLIALMGLTGIAVHVTTGRLREIGVRKTLGATPRQIVELLLLDFAKPVIIANLAAWPFAYFAAHAYIGLFLTRAAISPLPFVTSLVATVLIAWIAVGGQALRAARVEPARVLHYQ
jgi:putative ABC transport system permease protein